MIYINGKWIKGKGKKFKSLNPTDNKIIWEGNYASISQVREAIKSANKAFPQWNKIGLKSRLVIIKKFYSASKFLLSSL